MKKLAMVALSVSLVMVLLSASIGTEEKVLAAETPVFKDISKHWAKSSIETAVKAGILNGYPDGTFKPENSITRAELLKVMALTAKLNVDAAVAGKPWYTSFQAALTDAKVYAAGDFSGDVNKPITRLEMAKLAIRSAVIDYRGKKLSNDELMFRAVNAGLLSRTGTKAETIDPKGTTIRAQAAVLVARLLKLQNGDKLTVDQGASSAAEIAWHRHNMITMFGQDDLVEFPYSFMVDAKYKLKIDKLIVLDPADKKGYFNEYLEGAEYFIAGESVSDDKGFVFAYKLIGENLIKSNESKDLLSAFYMFTEANSGPAQLSSKYHYWDLTEKDGLFYNRMNHSFAKKTGSFGHNYSFEFVSKIYVKSQIKEHGAFPIHLEKFKSYDGSTRFYLTDVKD